MLDLTAILTAGVAFFVVAVTPGPATLSNAAIAMAKGRKVSLVYGAGLSCGLVFWGLIAASGIGAILQTSQYLLMVLKLLGGVYLLWLAIQSGQSALHANEQVAAVTTEGKWFVRGLVLNLSNPKTVVAWMAALSVGVDSNADGSAVFAATAICMVVGFLVNAMYSVLFSTTGMMEIYLRCRKKVDAFVSMLFAFAGLGLIHSALRD